MNIQDISGAQLCDRCQSKTKFGSYGLVIHRTSDSQGLAKGGLPELSRLAGHKTGHALGKRSTVQGPLSHAPLAKKPKRMQRSQSPVKPKTSNTLGKRSMAQTPLTQAPPAKKPRTGSLPGQYSQPSSGYTSVANRSAVWTPPTAGSRSGASAPGGTSSFGVLSDENRRTAWSPPNMGTSKRAETLPSLGSAFTSIANTAVAWTPPSARSSSQAGLYGNTSTAGPSSIQDAFRANQVREDKMAARFFWVSEIQRALLIVEGACVMCTDAEVRVDAHTKGLMDCPILRDRTDDNELHRNVFLDGWRKRLNYPRSAMSERVCYNCHIPNGPNDVLHGAFTSGTTCERRDYVAGVGYLVWVADDVRNLASVRFGVNWSSFELYIGWMVRTDPSHGYPTNMIAVFVWYVETYLG